MPVIDAAATLHNLVARDGCIGAPSDHATIGIDLVADDGARDCTYTGGDVAAVTTADLMAKNASGDAAQDGTNGRSAAWPGLLVGHVFIPTFLLGRIHPLVNRRAGNHWREVGKVSCADGACAQRDEQRCGYH